MPSTVLQEWYAKGSRLDIPGSASTPSGAMAPAPRSCVFTACRRPAYLYRKVLPELASRELEGVAMDFPGLGFADRPGDFDYTWTGLSAWLEKALAAAQIDSFHVVPVCFVYLNGCLYTAVDEKPKSGRHLRRLRNIEANPQVAFVFDRYEDDWERLAWVLVRGQASLVTDKGEKAQGVAALRSKYEQYDSMALEQLPLIRVNPEQAASWGAV